MPAVHCPPAEQAELLVTNIPQPLFCPALSKSRIEAFLNLEIHLRAMLDLIFLLLLAAIKTPGQNEMFDENQKQMEILLGQYNASQPIDEFVSGKVIIHKLRGDVSIGSRARQS